MKRLSMLCIIGAILSGCMFNPSIRPDIAKIRTGQLAQGIHSSNFKDEWGLPERIKTCGGMEWKTINHYTGDVKEQSQALECWYYDKQGVMLAFYERALVDWKTEKTIPEIAKIWESGK